MLGHVVGKTSRNALAGVALAGQPASVWNPCTVVVWSETLDADHVTDVLGLIPSRTFRRGDPYLGTRRRERHSWELDSTLDDDSELSMQEQVTHLLDLLWARRDRVADLLAECEIALVVGLATDSGIAVYELDHPTIERMAALGMTIQIMLYDDDKIAATVERTPRRRGGGVQRR